MGNIRHNLRIIIPLTGLVCAFFVLFFLIMPQASKPAVPEQKTVEKPVNKDHELLYAASAGDSVKCAYLLGQGANINIRDKAGRTALMRAARRGHNETVVVLLQSGCAIDLKDSLDDQALAIAASAGKIDVVRTLLRFGANVNAGKDRCRTALLLAAAKGHNEIIELLLQHGASLYEGQTENKGPLAAALHNKHSDTALLLLRADAPVNEIDHNGNSVLGMAVLANAEDVVKYILDSRIFSLHHCNQQGKSILDLAYQLNNPVIINMLEKHK